MGRKRNLGKVDLGEEIFVDEMLIETAIKSNLSPNKEDLWSLEKAHTVQDCHEI